ncbi:REP-associated tyrosine transposase [Luteimonas suaedae]|uniref:REP-associated tyrosine transposase n=1 Tax=Luteimonas suaedae TaxID=2605430 RepID=UPI0029394E0D|nr:transposase [Luteimonas suaedae]
MFDDLPMPTSSSLSQTPRRGHAALRTGRISAPGRAYHLTLTTQQRTPLFQEFDAACAAAACLHDPVLTKGARMLAWVVMPDHVHCLLQLDGQRSLGATISTLKSGSARRINRTLGRTGPVWSRAYHDHALRGDEDLRATARYIVANPIRAGLARKAGDYPFWNAIWL